MGNQQSNTIPVQQNIKPKNPNNIIKNINIPNFNIKKFTEVEVNDIKSFEKIIKDYIEEYLKIYLTKNPSIYPTVLNNLLNDISKYELDKNKMLEILKKMPFTKSNNQFKKLYNEIKKLIIITKKNPFINNNNKKNFYNNQEDLKFKFGENLRWFVKKVMINMSDKITFIIKNLEKIRKVNNNILPKIIITILNIIEFLYYLKERYDITYDITYDTTNTTNTTNKSINQIKKILKGNQLLGRYQREIQNNSRLRNKFNFKGNRIIESFKKEIISNLTKTKLLVNKINKSQISNKAILTDYNSIERNKILTDTIEKLYIFLK